MAKSKRPPLWLTEEQCGIVLGLLDESQRKMALRLNELLANPETEPEKVFLRAQMTKFEALDTLVRAHDPRRYDTSQDVDPDEWVVGEDDEED